MSFESVKLLSLNIIDAISLETNKTKMDPHMCRVSSNFFPLSKMILLHYQVVGGGGGGEGRIIGEGGERKRKKVGGGGERAGAENKQIVICQSQPFCALPVPEHTVKAVLTSHLGVNTNNNPTQKNNHH